MKKLYKYTIIIIVVVIVIVNLIFENNLFLTKLVTIKLKKRRIGESIKLKKLGYVFL